MGASIECREPFLDPRLIVGLGSLEDKWLFTGKKWKFILKSAMEKRLPDEILKFRKEYFEHWFKKSENFLKKFNLMFAEKQFTDAVNDLKTSYYNGVAIYKDPTNPTGEDGRDAERPDRPYGRADGESSAGREAHRHEHPEPGARRVHPGVPRPRRRLLHHHGQLRLLPAHHRAGRRGRHVRVLPHREHQAAFR